MLKQVIGKEVIERDAEWLQSQLSPYFKTVIDVGTGDGKFAYEMAKRFAENFYIGTDADKQQLEDLSHKSQRKPEKGGLPNVIFIWAPVEEMPSELDYVADEVYVNFPWGSLLGGVINTDENVMGNITRLAKPNASLEITTTYDTKFEPQKIESLELPELTLDYLDGPWRTQVQKFGWDLKLISQLTSEEKKHLIPSWPKKILSQRDREVFNCKLIKYD